MLRPPGVVVSTTAFSVPVKVLTEQHVTAHARRLGPMVTVVLVERGSGVVTDRLGRYEVHTGDVVVFEPEAEFRYTPTRPIRITMMMLDEGMLLDSVSWRHAHQSAAGRARVRAIATALSRPVIVLQPTPSASRRLGRLLHTVKEVQKRPPSEDRVLRAMTLLSQMMEIIDPLVMRDHPERSFASQIQAAGQLEFPTVRHPGIHRALEFVATRPPTEWSVAALAEQARLSPGHFTRVFTREVGCSPREFLSERRLTEFILLVQSSSLTVSQAARRVGWASTSHAIAVFRRQTGSTPTRFRTGVARDDGESMIRPGERVIPPPGVESDHT